MGNGKISQEIFPFAICDPELRGMCVRVHVAMFPYGCVCVCALARVCVCALACVCVRVCMHARLDMAACQYTRMFSLVYCCVCERACVSVMRLGKHMCPHVFVRTNARAVLLLAHHRTAQLFSK